MTRHLLAVTLGTLALVAVSFDADAAGKRARDRTTVERDCRPFNGPSGYEGNPWCDGGWKFAEDYPPGTSPYFDVLDLPQVQRLRRRWSGD
ncbi:MAG: hypothetical protein J0H65_03500 [Rhizobiales bacterium]|nr:hypothetical protein [Hyphomicrobiales bacterium]